MNRLANAITSAARHFAERPALIGPARTYAFAEVENDSNCLASALIHAFALDKGDRVAIYLANCPEYVITDFALIKGGLVRVPINSRLVGPEVEYILNDAGATVLITDEEHWAIVSTFAENLETVRHIVVLTEIPPAGTTAWRDALSRGNPGPFHVDAGDDDPLMLIYTSGTTGRPKGALTDVRSRWSALYHSFSNEAFFNRDDVMLHAASLAHGTATKVLPHYLRGAANVLPPRFDAELFCQAVEDHRVTTTWMVPTMIAMLIDVARTNRHDLSSLHTIMYAGASMPESIMRDALEMFGPIFVQIYALTEAPQPDLILPKEDHIPDPETGKRPHHGATGRAAIGVDVRVVDENGQDVADDTIGEVIIAGPHIMTEYWNNPEATAETVRDGWLYTGDLARIDDAGYIYVVDRKKDMIISGGYNIYPKEVEEVIYHHPAVRECAVIGRPDEHWGETVEAVVSLHPGHDFSAEDLVAHCAERLAGYKKPRKVSIIDDLPKTATGKIDKKAIRGQPTAETP